MVEKVNADTSAIFEQTFRAHFKSLHAYARSIIKDEATAEEIVQNIFLKLWEKKEQILQQHSVTAYLYRAVHNESLNFLKHNKVKADYNAYATLSNKVYEQTSDPAVIKELQQKIDKALNELPEQCRTIFYLSRFEDLKYRMIADQLGIPVKTVENQMGKALRILRLKLIDFLPTLLVLFINMKNTNP